MLIGLIYLHVIQSRLIFQPDIEGVRNLAMIALTMLLFSTIGSPLFALLLAHDARNHRSMSSIGEVFVVFGLVFTLVIWILVIVAYGKFFAGCRKLAFFKKGDSVDPLLRAKVSEILLEVIERKVPTDEYRMFLHVSHEDPLVEAIRSECEKTEFSFYTFTDEVQEKLGVLAEKLKE